MGENMSENKKNIPEGELNDDALDKVAGGKFKLINGRFTRVCEKCDQPLPHWYQSEICEDCKKKLFG